MFIHTHTPMGHWAGLVEDAASVLRDPQSCLEDTAVNHMSIVTVKVLNT